MPNKELVDKMGEEIRTSDFHIPEFISGIPCADGNEEYKIILERHTVQLATACATIAQEYAREVNADLINELQRIYDKYGYEETGNILKQLNG